jgi:hypothetical protein
MPHPSWWLPSCLPQLWYYWCKSYAYGSFRSYALSKSASKGMLVLWSFDADLCLVLIRAILRAWLHGRGIFHQLVVYLRPRTNSQSVLTWAWKNTRNISLVAFTHFINHHRSRPGIFTFILILYNWFLRGSFQFIFLRSHIYTIK